MPSSPSADPEAYQPPQDPAPDDHQPEPAVLRGEQRDDHDRRPRDPLGKDGRATRHAPVPGVVGRHVRQVYEPASEGGKALADHVTPREGQPVARPRPRR